MYPAEKQTTIKLQLMLNAGSLLNAVVLRPVFKIDAGSPINAGAFRLFEVLWHATAGLCGVRDSASAVHVVITAGLRKSSVV